MKIIGLFAITIASLSIHAQTVDPKVHADKYCKDEWTKMGQLNQRMYDFCMKQEQKGFDQVQLVRKELGTQAWFTNFVDKQCHEHWTKAGVIQFNMVAACFRTEKEGHDEMAYQVTQPSYSSAQAEACFAKWKNDDSGVFGMTAYCYKNKSETANGTGNELATLLNAKAAAVTAATPTPPTPPAANTGVPAASAITTPAPTAASADLIGFDLDMQPNEFREKYKDKIKACKADKYENKDVTPKFTVPTYSCEFKDNAGSISFYATKGKYHVYNFQHKFPQTGVRMRVAANKLSEKVGKAYEVSTYANTFFTFCGAVVPFYNGEAAITSENLIGKMVDKMNRGVSSDNGRCTDDVFIDVDAAQVRYDNSEIKKAMNDALIQLRIKDEDSKGQDVKL